MNLGKIEHDILKLKVNPTEIKENTLFQLYKKKMSSFTENLLIFWRCFPTSHLFRLDFKQAIYMVYLKGQSKYKLFLSEM